MVLVEPQSSELGGSTTERASNRFRTVVNRFTDRNNNCIVELLIISAIDLAVGRSITVSQHCHSKCSVTVGRSRRILTNTALRTTVGVE